MFSALNQGSLVYIVDKTDGLKYKTGEIISTSSNNLFNGTFGSSNFTPNGKINLKIRVDNNVIDYPEAPLNGSVASYNNGNILVCETKQNAITEIERILKEAKHILENRTSYEKQVNECEAVLKDINPVFAKDKEFDDRINNLNTRFSNMEDKLDKVLSAVLPNINATNS